MHQTHPRPRRPSAARWGAWTVALLLGVHLGGPAFPAHAREERAARRTVLAPVSGTVRLRMCTKKPIRTVSNPKETALTVRTVLGDPATVRLIGHQPDTSQVELTDAEGNTELYEMIVQPVRKDLSQGSIRPGPKSKTEDAARRVEQVRLDVTVVEVRPGRVPAFAFQFLKRSGQILTGRRGSPRPFAGILRRPEDADDFLALLRTLEKEGLAKFVAQRDLVTLSGQPMSFLTGGERAIPVPPGPGGIGVQFEEFGTRLSFLPVVRANRKVHLEVEPEVSTLDPAAGVVISGTIVPGRVTNRFHVEGDLGKGQTLLLGGLVSEASTEKWDTLPDIRQLPFIGFFFPEGKTGAEAVELVILVTPSVVGQKTGGR